MQTRPRPIGGLLPALLTVRGRLAAMARKGAPSLVTVARR